MNTYRPNPRDPLTARTARQLRDTISDPYAYSDGPREPQYIVQGEHAVDSGLRRWGPLAIVVLAFLLASGWL